MRDLFEEQNRILVFQHRELMAFLNSFRCGSSGDAVTKHDLKELEKKIMATQAEVAAELRALKTQVDKVAVEQSTRFDTLTQKVADLEAAIAAGGDATPEVSDALTGVKTALQSLDDTIPDAPATPPTV